MLFVVGMMRQVEDSYVLQRSLDVISKWCGDNRMQLLENTFPSQVQYSRHLFEEACLGRPYYGIWAFTSVNHLFLVSKLKSSVLALVDCSDSYLELLEVAYPLIH